MMDARIVLGLQTYPCAAARRATSLTRIGSLGFSVIYLEPSSGCWQWYPVRIGSQVFPWRDREYQG